MLPLLPTRRRPRCRSTSCLLRIGLVALYHSLLAGLLMHFWVASSAGLQHENLELAGRVSELSGRVAALQQLQERSVESLQMAPKPARKPAPAPKAVLPASAAPTDRCGREESGPPPPDPKASSESVILVGERTRITLLTMATLRLEHLSAAAPAGRFDDRASFAFVNRRLPQPSYTVRVERCTLLPPDPSPPASSSASASASASSAAAASSQHAGSTSLCLVVRTALLRLEYLVPTNQTEHAVPTEGDSCEARPQGGYACPWAAVTPPNLSLT